MSRKKAIEAGPPPPDARSHLPGWLERHLLKRFGDSAGQRVGGAALLRAMSVLVRRHPKAALDMAVAGAVQAGRTSLSEAKRGLSELGSGLGAGRADKPIVDAATLPLPPVEEARRDLAENLGKREMRELRDMLETAEPDDKKSKDSAAPG